MIKEFGFRNFFCFKEGGVVSFKYDKNAPDEIQDNSGVGTVLGIKGANGSGKTNIIKALGFIKDFIASSSNSDVGEPIQVDTFRNEKGSSEFYVEFSLGDIDYIYELEVVEDGVVSEVLWRKNARKSQVFRRKGNDIEYCVKDLKEIKNIKLKSNASVISMVKKYNFKSSMDEFDRIVRHFETIMTNVNYTGLSHSLNKALSYDNNSKKYFEDEKAFGFVKALMKYADPGIKDIEIATRKNEKNETIHFPVFRHESDGEDFLLTIYDESSGTQQLFRILYVYWLTLASGTVIALDEFDIHLHALILPKIIELFQDKEVNKHGAQLIFTAHNTEIIDSLGKYRTILVNKENNESYCYRLDELPSGLLRNGRPIAPLYVKGKIGGVPKV